MGVLQNKSVEIDLSDNGERLYVFFGGIMAGIAMPPFEFYSSSKIIDEHKIFVRDFSQCWYHCGLLGISEDINGTAKYIQQKVKEIKPKKTFLVGNSMGGYAAILFSSFIDNAEVIAFSPQTFISPFLRLKNRDFRWNRQIIATYRVSIFKRKEWNLKYLLLRSGRNQKISIYFSKNDSLDCIHAAHLKDVEGVELHGFVGGGHGVVKLLRDAGMLPAIMSGTYI